ncbi:uncharacterized protein LOC133884231 [Phragmites australis]|uniref:uncharacterized protein LOC133884231 n=1 Tax=Phragmites australis TaxID=29695 RepID=UPI002D781887|nr:uncharacterized protein LOC133884231 [Phragmites australis]XP_062179564.1 uncharacterized protein LOC133884231 [Phragmites australis]
MGGHSCGLEGAPGVTPGGVSLAGAVCTDIPPEKRCALVDETCQQAESGNGSLEAEMCLGFSKSISLGVKKGLQKCSTFPTSSSEPQQDVGSCRHVDDRQDAPVYERSVSLPPTLKLVSAMKGSRQKNGMESPTENRHVKWAPDVYDPPVTSVCHSVNSSYQHRSKPRKKEKNKQKKKQKRKPKKNQQNSIQNPSVLQAPDLGLKDVCTSGGRSALDDLGRLEAEMVDYSIGNQEAKCGSSFLRETIAKMHFSIAEAS